MDETPPWTVMPVGCRRKTRIYFPMARRSSLALSTFPTCRPTQLPSTEWKSTRLRKSKRSRSRGKGRRNSRTWRMRDFPSRKGSRATLQFSLPKDAMQNSDSPRMISYFLLPPVTRQQPTKRAKVTISRRVAVKHCKTCNRTRGEHPIIESKQCCFESCGKCNVRFDMHVGAPEILCKSIPSK